MYFEKEIKTSKDPEINGKNSFKNSEDWNTPSEQGMKFSHSTKRRAKFATTVIPTLMYQSINRYSHNTYKYPNYIHSTINRRLLLRTRTAELYIFSNVDQPFYNLYQ
jgi:hypothetical protein